MKKFLATSLAMGAMLFLSIILLSNSSDQIKVSGTITDALDGSQLPGATVVIQGTQNGTITNINGYYELNTKLGAKLVVSYLGYETQTIKVTGNEHNVKLSPTMNELSESIVIGYGTQSKQKLIGSVSSVQGDRSSKRSKRSEKFDFIYADESSTVSSEDLSSRSVTIQDHPAPTQPNQITPAPAPQPYLQQGEEYAPYVENGFIAVSAEPLSTFSIDVDNAAYSNIRRVINSGQLPNRDMVRIEEMINYFNYDYPQPKGTDPVHISSEVGQCPWNNQHRLVKIGLKAREVAEDKLPASNFVFLIDVSGSMSGPTRIDLVKSSLRLLVNNLRPQDRVAIVTYASNVGLRLPSTSGSDKQAIMTVIDGLYASGGTAGGEGILLAYKAAKENFVKGGNNRVILCTDGDFNIGPSGPIELEALIERERQSGVFLSVLGYGMGNYKDNRMQVLAQKGNGNHAYINDIQEANKVLVQEFSSTLWTIAKDVKLQVEFNTANVQAYRLIGYETRLLAKEDFNNDVKDAGEMGAGHTVTALYEVVPVGVNSNWNNSVDPLRYGDQKTEISNTGKKELVRHTGELMYVKLRYKQPDGDESKLLQQPVYNKSNRLSDDFNFAASVALFGQLLQGSPYVQGASYDDVISLANQGLSSDKHGYRREFVRLAESVKGLSR